MKMATDDVAQPEQELPSSLSETRPDLQDFQHDDVKHAITRIMGDHDRVWHEALENAARDFATNNELRKGTALKFLACAIQAMLKPSDVSRPLAPMFVFEDKRGLIPDDFDDEQIALMGELAQEIENPILRARLYDICWVRTKNHQYATPAIEAYLEATRLFFADNAFAERILVVSALDYLERAIRLTLYSFKPNQRPTEAIDELLALGPRFVDLGELGSLRRVEELVFHLNLGDGAERAALIEAAVEEKPGDPHTIRDLWLLAAQWRSRLDNHDAKNADRIRAAETMVALANMTVNSEKPSYMAAASHLGDALKIYRQVPGENARKETLRNLLAQYQANIRDEMASHSVEIDLTEAAEQARQHVEGKTLPNALAAFALMVPPSNLEELEKMTMEIARANPLMHYMSITITDHDGRTVDVVPSLLAPQNDEEAQKALRYHMIKNAGFHYTTTGVGMIEPARRVIWEEHEISTETLYPLARGSFFVPHGHERTFAKGIAEGLSGDYSTALNILVPQLENALREQLKRQGHNINTRERGDNVTQEAITLPRLLDHESVAEMLGEELLFDMQAVFTDKLGDTVRHNIAHGVYGDGALNSATGAYAFALIMRLIITPLLPSAINEKPDELAHDDGAQGIEL